MWIRNVACTLQTVCPRSGKLTHERVFRSTSVAYCIDERDQRVLVVGREVALARQNVLRKGIVGKLHPRSRAESARCLVHAMPRAAEWPRIE